MPTFQTILHNYRPLIQAEIARMLAPTVMNISGQTNQGIEAYHQQLVSNYPNRGGKYIRPILLMLTAEALGAPLSETAITAAAMELCQNWLLIHDDIEDDSTTRRGLPTLHQVYDIPQAINAGDALHILMWWVLGQNQAIVGAAKTLAIMEEFGQMLFRTTMGQTAELKLVTENRYDVSEEECLYIMDGKTGYYTFAGPMRLGAILAVNDQAYLRHTIFPALNAFGCYLGRAFQIKDDLLDVTSDFDGLKVVGNDIYEGKRSLLLAHLLGQVTPETYSAVIAIMSKPRAEKTAEEVNTIIKLMAQSGTLDYARQQAEMWAEKACQSLAAMDFFVDDTTVNYIHTLTKFVIGRTF